MKGGAMPVYQYKCKSCGKVFEISCHLSEREQLAVCPGCGGKEVEQVFSTFTSPPPSKW
jgi:putative FmdB family regulatory protein